MNIIIFGYTINWVAQLLGLIGLILLCFAFKVNRKTYLALMIFGHIVFGAESGVLGGYTNLSVNLLASLRNIALLLLLVRGKDMPNWGKILTIVLTIIPAFFLTNTWYDLLPIFFATCYNLLVLQKNFFVLQIGGALLETGVIFYLLIIGAYVGVIRQLLAIIFILIAIFKAVKLKSALAKNNPAILEN